ncbi:MAG: SDR family NAD(P)-dependent oxidoreductase [Halieaceae bacterium]|nr:SDR family NAD(P)-dependent oxidoreductase [Halieaceae bacterium]
MSNQKKLEDRVAIITGASRGIGAGIATYFAQHGAKLALVARTLEPQEGMSGSLQETANAITKMGGEVLCVQANLADPEDRAKIIPTVLAHFGKVDILINNAAWCRFIPIWEVTPKQWQLAFEMNVNAPQTLSQQVAQAMIQQGEGWILNISSATSDQPPTTPYERDARAVQFNRDGHPTLYGTTKAALERLSTGWAIELSPHNIAVNALAPVGVVLSEGAMALNSFSDEDHVESIKTMAEAALQLCTRPAAELSGHSVRSIPLLKSLRIPIPD